MDPDPRGRSGGVYQAGWVSWWYTEYRRQHLGTLRKTDRCRPSFPADPHNPYADYRALNLYQFLGRHGVARPADAGFLYSNLGFGLLGQALANRAGTSYPQLVAEQVTVPLHLEDTVVSLSAQQQRRFIAGHTADGRPARAWEVQLGLEFLTAPAPAKGEGKPDLSAWEQYAQVLLGANEFTFVD